ncbi:hypothetical protein A1704_23460 [Chryseobacterium cucumeris]|uniref:hypothetical protein n=1 Tax=Chryseobacterium cucumeris TaxID=1813611 RepID=UPI0007949E57|nr:hypothetical protein [Chryseobacterium cucumeris]KYH06641.1 hypothetical protein A1704_23460 [Chryseobacterium cucumeris]
MISKLYTSKDEINYTFLYSFQQEYSDDHNGNILIFEILEKGKGISRAIILYYRFLFGRRVISERGGDNWPDARNKVWERMKSDGEVAYCETKDFYFTIL